MKNLDGFLYVFLWCLAAVLVVTIFIAAALSVYGILAVLVVFVMAKSYLILGNTWFFIIWPVLIAALVAYKYYIAASKKIESL